jgi:hypothetical protein
MAADLAECHGAAPRRLTMMGTAVVLLRIIGEATGAFVDGLAMTLWVSATFVACSALAG